MRQASDVAFYQFALSFRGTCHLNMRDSVFLVGRRSRLEAERFIKSFEMLLR